MGWYSTLINLPNQGYIFNNLHLCVCIIWPPVCVVWTNHLVVVSQPRSGTTTALGSVASCCVPVRIYLILPYTSHRRLSPALPPTRYYHGILHPSRRLPSPSLPSPTVLCWSKRFLLSLPNWSLPWLLWHSGPANPLRRLFFPPRSPPPPPPFKPLLLCAYFKDHK